MSCDPVSDVLPWFANGTLDPAERARVEAHLAECAACRAALDDTLALGSAAASHLPIDLLLDLADGVELSADDAALAERHLAECPSCAAELRWARLAEELPEPVDPPPVEPSRRPARSAPAPWLALAAVLVLAVVGVATWSPWSRSVLSEKTASEASDTPIVRATLVELVPETVERGNEAPPVVVLDGSASHLTVVLISDVSPPEDAELVVEWIGPDAESSWTRDGLVRTASGLYTLVLPTATLVPGDHHVRVLTDHSGAPSLLEAFRFQVTRGAEAP
ncbi:MAG: zf-HC2 domain-containing protein [Acidobacteriota bacterium]